MLRRILFATVTALLVAPGAALALVPANPDITEEQANYLVYAPHVTDAVCANTWKRVSVTARGRNEKGPTINRASGWIKNNLAELVVYFRERAAAEGLRVRIVKIEVSAGPTPDANGCGPKEKPEANAAE